MDAKERTMKSQTATIDIEPQRLDEAGLKQLFLDARSHNRWQERPVDDAVLRELYDMVKLAPTSANSQPMRLVFVKSREGKQKVKLALPPPNVEKTMTAPVTAIVAHDLEFYEQLPRLMPHVNARSWFASRPIDQIERAAFQGSAMQGAYLILATRGFFRTGSGSRTSCSTSATGTSRAST
jgi:3-hydroxypropanoate dehydrogenase